MFERFTQDVRRVLVLAQGETRLLGHPYLGTEHLVLGLIRQADGVAAKALAELGVTSEAMHVEIAHATVSRAESAGRRPRSPQGAPPFTPNARRALENSARDAANLGDDDIGTEHVLLGITHDPDNFACRILTELGANPERIRHQVMSVLSADPERARRLSLHRGGDDDMSNLSVDEMVFTVATEPPTARCPVCRAALEHLSWRAMVARPAEGAPENPAGSMGVIVVCCPRCGAIVGLVPGQGPGGPAGSAGVREPRAPLLPSDSSLESAPES